VSSRSSIGGGEETDKEAVGRYLCSSWATVGSRTRRAWDHAAVAVAMLAVAHTLCGYGEIQWTSEPLVSGEPRRLPTPSPTLGEQEQAVSPRPLQRVAMTLNRVVRWTHEGVLGCPRRERWFPLSSGRSIERGSGANITAIRCIHSSGVTTRKVMVRRPRGRSVSA
jgi:hypothetical protein